MGERRIIENANNSKIELVYDIRTFCEVSMELLNSDNKYDFLLSHYFNKMNNWNLAEYCLSRRYLETPETLLSLLNSIFKFSPSALNHALFGDNSKYIASYEHHSKFNEKVEKVPELLLSAFVQEIIPRLLEDLHGGKNKPINNLPQVVTLLEEFHLKLANTWEVFFEINVSGMTSFLVAGEDIEAGQLVSLRDPLTRFNSEMTNFKLLNNIESINGMIKVYEEIHNQNAENEDLAGLANNIGICYMALRDYENAKMWLNKGLEYNENVAQLHDNLKKIEEILSKNIESGESSKL